MKQLNTQPFTYRISWTEYDKHYYGVKYAIGCKPEDLWVTYFTSSPSVKEFILKHGDPDIIQIRKTFKCRDTAIKWESKVLKRIKAASNIKYLNRNESPAPPVMYGDENPSRRIDVREKLRMSSANRPKPSEDIKQKISFTKRKKNITNYFRNKKYKEEPVKSELYKLNNWVSFLEDMGKYKKIINTLKIRINLISLIEKKPYPKDRKRSKRGKMSSISNAKLGTKWYTNQHTGEIRAFRLNDEIPIGFVPGMKNRKKPKIFSEEHKRKLSISMANVRRKQKNEKLYYDESKK